MRRERLYLEDIIDSIEKIQSFTAEMDFNSFMRDDKTKSAVIRGGNRGNRDSDHFPCQGRFHRMRRRKGNVRLINEHHTPLLI
jgi:hypothetical protein